MSLAGMEVGTSLLSLSFSLPAYKVVMRNVILPEQEGNAGTRYNTDGAEGIVLSATRQTQKNKQRAIPRTRGLQSCHIDRNRRWKGGCPGLREGGRERSRV